jgi:hypothetical protein
MITPQITTAQEGPSTFSLPAGCDAYLTVQNKDCSVDHHFICEGDPEGNKSRVSLSQMGMTYVGTVDDETQWINSLHVMSDRNEILGENPTDPASLTELIEIGIDTYDFTTISNGTEITRFVGQDSLTGQQFTIDGVTLDETQYNITAYDSAGEVIWKSEGNEFINRNWRFFLAGRSLITTPDDQFETDGSPVEFIYPGEPGFLSAHPKHGCGVEMSNALPTIETPLQRLMTLASY